MVPPRPTQTGRRATTSRGIAGTASESELKKIPATWNADSIGEFREWVAEKGAAYVGSAFISDCADLAITLLITFAKSKGLPVSLERRSVSEDWSPRNAISAWRFRHEFGDMLSLSDTGGDYDKLLKIAKQKFGASHLYNVRRGNTKEVPRDSLTTGDLLVGEPHNHPGVLHTQVVLSSPDVRITVVDIEGIIALMKQKSVTAEDWKKAVTTVEALEILQGSQTTGGGGTQIMRRAWGVQTLAYYEYWNQQAQMRETLGEHNIRPTGTIYKQIEVVGSKSPFGADATLLPRRWDFDDFNRPDR